MIKKKLYQRTIVSACMAMDILAIILADLFSFILRFNGTFPPNNFDAYIRLAPLIMATRLAAFYMFRFYEKPKYKSDFEMFVNSMNAMTASSTIIIFFVYFVDIPAYPRSIAFLSWLLTIMTVSGWRFVMKQFLELYMGKDYFLANLVIIGTGKQAEELAMEASRNPSINYKLVGYLKPRRDSQVSVESDMVLGTVSDIPRIIGKFDIDEMVISDASFERRELIFFAPLMLRKGIELKSAPSSYERVITNIMLGSIETPFVGPALSKRPALWYWPLKRIFDTLSAVLLLILTSPIFLVAVILIKTTSPGPVLYFQKRVGQFGRYFVMFKLRTMYTNAEKGKPVWARKKDTRITPVGVLLRRYRIDELPQLFNVLKNDMSIIGPRPERPYFVQKLIRDIPFYAERLQVKPGITGWAQVNFKYSDSEEEAKKKLVYDLFYTQNMSLHLDLLIALKTVGVILTGKGAQ